MDQSTGRIGASPSDAGLAVPRRAEYDGHKPLHEIEEDIARTRLRLRTMADALERELVPARFVEKGTAALWSSLKPHPGPFRNQLRGYAIPLAMILVGLGWVVALRRNSWEASLPSEFGEMPDEAAEVSETPMPPSVHPGLVEPVEPVSLTDQTV